MESVLYKPSTIQTFCEDSVSVVYIFLLNCIEKVFDAMCDIDWVEIAVTQLPRRIDPTNRYFIGIGCWCYPGIEHMTSRP